MSDLLFFPAIDVRAGKCVRLLRGNFADETIYGDPLEQAHRYSSEGAQWIHLVDLDAARGDGDNRATIAAILARDLASIEIGGGVRSADDATYFLDRGAQRVVIGTAAVESPTMVDALVDRYPGRIVLGLDHRRIGTDEGPRRMLAVRGWEGGTSWTVEEALARFADKPIAAAVITDIARDGAMSGPDLDGYGELLEQTDLPLVASGGVTNADDLRALARLCVHGRNLEGAIVGRALLEGALTVGEAMAACAR